MPRKTEALGVSYACFQQGLLYLARHAGQWVTRAQLQKELEISKPTAHRLITALSIQFPLIEEEGPRNQLRIQLPPHMTRTLHDILLITPTITSTDNLVLQLLLTQGETDSPLAPLIADVRNHLSSLNQQLGIHITPSGNANQILRSGKQLTYKLSEQSLKLVEKLFFALDRRHPCTIAYQRIHGTETKRYLVFPIGMFSQGGCLYVYVYHPDIHDGNPFVLSCNRIKDVVVDEAAHYSCPAEFSLDKKIEDPFGIIEDPVVVCEIWIDARQTPYLKERNWPDKTQFINQDDGSMILVVGTGSYGQMFRWLLSQGAHAKLQRPQILVDQFSQEVQKLAQTWGFINQ